MNHLRRIAWIAVGLSALALAARAWALPSEEHGAKSLSSVVQKVEPPAGSGGGGSGSLNNLQKSFSHFASPWYALSLLSGLALAAGCASAMAWHPRRSVKSDPVEDLEQRKTLILMGIVGAIVSELVRANSAMALVIFGIGGLIRFRTVLDNPKLTGKAILVVVIGLACGLGEFAMAVFITIFAWLLVFWLDSSVGCRIRLKMTAAHNSKDVMLALLDLMRRHKVRVTAANDYEHKRQIVVLGKMPTQLDPIQFAATMRQRLPRGDDLDIDLKMG
jgi:hypothetical protein